LHALQASSSSCQCPAAEAVKLLNRHRWREGDVALLAAAAARLGLPGGAMPEEPTGDTDRP
jgi:hypothetical protein